MTADAPAESSARPRRGRLIGSAILAGVVVAGAVFGFQEWRLARNLANARDHAALLRQRLGDDNRFLGVTLKESPALNGSLLVGGFVIDNAAATDLRDLLDSTAPPVPVDWQLRVLGAAAVGEALSKLNPPGTAPAATQSQ